MLLRGGESWTTPRCTFYAKIHVSNNQERIIIIIILSIPTDFNSCRVVSQPRLERKRGQLSKRWKSKQENV